MFAAIQAKLADMDTPSSLAMTPPPAGPTYASYLRLDRVLDAQAPLSDSHDELLFIVIHQASELWIKLCLHELRAARTAIATDQLAPALKMMTRVSRVQEQLIQSWGVLATITPSDYSAMRAALGSSSGFQSHQYRLMEFMMGNKNARMIDVHQGAPALQAMLAEELVRPSLYDEAISLLARRGFAISPEAYNRDYTQAYAANPAVEAAWAEVYRQPDVYWDLYELAEKLVDLEYRFQLWRFGHLKAIERVIGFKRGTGGSSGAPYLASVLDQVFFPELLDVRKVL
jgi:tryptophan 2,3-dioxygenase